MSSTKAILFIAAATCILSTCCAARTQRAQKRKDSPDSISPPPSVETIKQLAEAMGAAEFESYTEGAKPIVKRLIPDNSEPDLDLVTYQGIVGRAGVDFPAFPSIPDTGFNCRHVATGYYADLETDCQVFHICDSHRKISFLCPNGTIFSQSHLICDWWFKVDCASSPALYEASAEQYSQEQSKRQRNSRPSKPYDDQNINTGAQQKKQQSKQVVSSTERQFHVEQPVYEANTYSAQVKASARAFQSIIDAKQQRENTGFEKRRKNLVQLIANNDFDKQNQQYKDANTYRTPTTERTYQENQVAAESAGIANNRNMQLLQDYNNNFKPYPVYSPVPTTRVNVKPTLPTYSTEAKSDQRNNFGRNLVSSVHFTSSYYTTKRPTLIPYSKFTTQEPYTRPGVNLLREFLHKEKNKTISKKDSFSDNTAFRFDSSKSVTQTPISRSENSFFTAAGSSPNVYYSANNIYGPTKPTYMEKQKSGKSLQGDYGDKTQPSRPGLIVPPSLTPNTLHSLAIYYATAIDNLSTPKNETESEPTTTANPDVLPTLLSEKTLNQYSSLFSMMGDSQELLEELRLENNGTSNELDDLNMAMSQGPLASSPQIRELAQVFTHALSAYLQDPVQFRKVLSDIRPTQPAFAEMITTAYEEPTNDELAKINEDEEEILGFSDDNKPSDRLLAEIREPSLIRPCCGLAPEAAKIQQTTTPDITETATPNEDGEQITTTSPPFTIRVEDTTTAEQPTTTTKLPFKCCGSISAAYTSASKEKQPSTTAVTTSSFDSGSSTENSYNLPKYGGFQNNSYYSPYGKDLQTRVKGSRPLGQNDIQSSTNVPVSWGDSTTFSSYSTTPATYTLANSVNSINDINNQIKEDPFERSPTSTDKYYSFFTTQADLNDNDNEEELQRAQSQSFLSPKENDYQRDGKNIKLTEKDSVRRPSQDLEVPPQFFKEPSKPLTRTTITYSASTKYLADESVSTPTTVLADGYATNYERESKFVKDAGNPYIWSTNFDNWHSTVVLDPITLNDGLNAMREEYSAASTNSENYNSQTNTWNSAVPSTTPTPNYDKYRHTTKTDHNGHQPTTQYYYPTTYYPSTGVTNSNAFNPTTRLGKLLNNAYSSTELSSTPLDEKVIEKAKDIMGEMNVTNGDTIMDAMKKTKSKTVKRLILLLVQTCDDDHNKTAEASKKALLEALMTLSQKEMEKNGNFDELTSTTPINFDIADRTSNTHRRMDQILSPYNEQKDLKQTSRTGKSVRTDTANSNSLINSTPSTTKPPKPTTISQKGGRKSLVSSSPLESKTKTAEKSEGRGLVADSKQTSDTRALELLRSLYSIAAKWG